MSYSILYPLQITFGLLFSARDHIQERNKGLRHLETNSKAVIADLKTLAEWGMLKKFIIKILFFESGRKTSNCYWQSGWLANKEGDKWWHQEMLQSATCYRLAGVVLTNETSFRQRGKNVAWFRADDIMCLVVGDQKKVCLQNIANETGAKSRLFSSVCPREVLLRTTPMGCESQYILWDVVVARDLMFNPTSPTLCRFINCVYQSF